MLMRNTYNVIIKEYVTMCDYKVLNLHGVTVSFEDVYAK